VTLVTVSFRLSVHNLDCHEARLENQRKRYSTFRSKAQKVLEDTGLDSLCDGGMSLHQASLRQGRHKGDAKTVLEGGIDAVTRTRGP